MEINWKRRRALPAEYCWSPKFIRCRPRHSPRRIDVFHATASNFVVLAYFDGSRSRPLRVASVRR